MLAAPTKPKSRPQFFSASISPPHRLKLSGKERKSQPPRTTSKDNQRNHESHIFRTRYFKNIRHNGSGSPEEEEPVQEAADKAVSAEEEAFEPAGQRHYREELVCLYAFLLPSIFTSEVVRSSRVAKSTSAQKRNCGHRADTATATGTRRRRYHKTTAASASSPASAVPPAASKPASPKPAPPPPPRPTRTPPPPSPSRSTRPS